MALPKIKHPLFDVEIPGEEKYKVRSMLVREEKILLMAKESDDRKDKLNSIMQIVNNCTQGIKNIEDLPLYKIEWLFLKIREYSISDITKVSFRDHGDEKVREFPITLSKVELSRPEEFNPSIDLGDGIAIILKAPTIKLLTSDEYAKKLEESPAAALEYSLMQCIDKIFQGDKAYDPKKSSPEELKEFIDNIPSKAYEDIQKFFDSIPHLNYDIKYINDQGVEREIKLRNLEDFFTF